jgi:hypothetical protein
VPRIGLDKDALLATIERDIGAAVGLNRRRCSATAPFLNEGVARDANLHCPAPAE